MLFKVLVNGRSAHGGNFAYPLPTDQPGDWIEVDGPLVPCSRGFHLTATPATWWLNGAAAYVAEAEGETIDEDNKVCCRKVRLLRLATDEELAANNVFTTGDHEIASGLLAASGSATVRASGSATVTAYDSATVRAYDSATVRAYGSATVTASGSATVTAYDSATVRAYDSATVRAYDSATVTAYDSATVNDYGGKSPAPTGYAILIDRSKNPPRIVAGWDAVKATASD